MISAKIETNFCVELKNLSFSFQFFIIKLHHLELRILAALGMRKFSILFFLIPKFLLIFGTKTLTYQVHGEILCEVFPSVNLSQNLRDIFSCKLLSSQGRGTYVWTSRWRCRDSLEESFPCDAAGAWTDQRSRVRNSRFPEARNLTPTLSEKFVNHNFQKFVSQQAHIRILIWGAYCLYLKLLFIQAIYDMA